MRAVRRTTVLLAGALIASGVATLPAQADDADPTTLAVEGTVRAVVVDRFGAEPSSDQLFTLMTDDGDEIPVDLDAGTPANGRFEGELVVDGDVEKALDAKDLLPREGSTIAQDTRAGRVAVAEAATQDTPLEVASSTVAPARAAAVTTPTAHRAYVARMTGVGSVDGTDAAVGASVDTMLGYWRAEPGAVSSFGRAGSITTFAAPSGVTLANGCGMVGPDDDPGLFVDRVWTAAARTFPGVNFDLPGNHLVVLVGDECGDSGPVGIAQIGSSVSDGGPSILTFDRDTFDQVGAHEIGHNVGLEHANLHSSTSTNPGFNEYLDLYSPMGLAVGGGLFAPPALGTLLRRQLGLSGTDETATVELPAGQTSFGQTYTIAPRSDIGGTRGLLVTDPTSGTTYSVDFRDGAGRDGATFYRQGGRIADPSSPVYATGVVIERQAPDGQTYLMTRTAADPDRGSFRAGEVFAPSAGLALRVDAVATAGATVTVTLPPPAPAPVPAPVASPAPGRLAAAKPRIVGTAKVGRTVKVKVGSWSPRPTFRYQWFANGRKISTKGTKSSFKLTSRQKGMRITVRVTGTRPGYATVATTSAKTGRVAKR